MDNFDFKDKVAIVTGGSSGLGNAAVKALFNKKCKIAILDIISCDDLLKTLNINEERVIFIKTDISNENDVKNAIENVIRKFKFIHIIVNSAGVAPWRSLENTDSETVIKTYGVNVFGQLYVIKYATKYMKLQNYLSKYNERGVVINVSSEQGTEGQSGRAIYCGTKGAINGMTLPLSRELGPFGIRVVTISPGMIMTPLVTANYPEEEVKEYSKEFALKRVGYPEEFGQCVISVCECSFMTGCIIRLDGGIRSGNAFKDESKTKF